MENTKHGMRHTRFWRIWRDSKKRCNNPNYKDYKIYGGRGIKNKWEYFLIFRDDMYESYLAHVEEFGEKNTTIDRYPDKNGDYCKENTRWATQLEQARNTARNHLITYKGKTRCLKEWEEVTGIKHYTIRARLGRLKWSIEKAGTTLESVADFVFRK